MIEKEKILFENENDWNTYVIRFYKDEDQKYRVCSVHVIAPATNKAEEIEIEVKVFEYPYDAPLLEVEEKAKMIAYNSHYKFS